MAARASPEKMSRAQNNYMSTVDNVGVEEMGLLNEGPRQQSRRVFSQIHTSVGIELLRVLVLSIIVTGCVVIITSGGTSGDTRNFLSSSIDTFNQKILHLKSRSHYSRLSSAYLNDDLNRKKTSDNVNPGCEGTVLILRHCEKNGDVLDSQNNYYCSYLGYERSQFIATLFGNEPEERWPAPSYLYAMSKHRPHRSNKHLREIETLEPLAEKLGNMDINSKYSSPDSDKLAREIFDRLRNGDMCGKLAVVSWRHSDMEKLARHLGCGPYEGCPRHYPVEEFDEVWQVKFVYEAPSPLELSYRRQRAAASSSSSAEASWSVYGSVVSQGFDPLKFSKAVGDYPLGGVDTGAAWKA